jgi:RND family efflux transporter MFP subunit
VTGRGNTAVRLKLIDEQDFSHQGRMDFVDNVVDRATGTIRGRAQFANADGLFTPGMFARVQVPGSAPYQALLVPDSAIGTEQARKFLLLVGPDNVVALRYVTLGDLVDGMRVIKSGLAPDDRVIVTGLMRARAGAKVTPQEKSAPPQASGPAPKSN